MSNKIRRAFAVSAYIEHKKAFLMVLHKKQQAWVPVGGEIAPGETPIEAIIREVEEETGLVWPKHYEFGERRTRLSPAGLITYEEHFAGPKGLHLNFAFHLKILGAERPTLKLCDEFTEARWAENLSQDLEPIPPNVREILVQMWGS